MASATGTVETLVSMVAIRTSATVNINTISNLVAALMSATGNPLTSSAELVNAQVTSGEKSIIPGWSKVESIVKPLLTGFKTEIADLPCDYFY